MDSTASTGIITLLAFSTPFCTPKNTISAVTPTYTASHTRGSTGWAM